MTTNIVLTAIASQVLTFTADRVAVDPVTKAAVATGNVVAVRSPYTLRSEGLSKTAEGKYLFSYPTYATTCTNELGHTHWNFTGEIEYSEYDYVLLRNAWLRFCEVPVFWLPYMYYPLGSDCGFSWIAGYTGRWGAYLMTKYRYHLLGDRKYEDDTWWLVGDTRFDMRYKNGLAVGEDLKWNLGDFGYGKFGYYQAWDMDAESRYGGAWGSRMSNWGSDVSKDRHIATLEHRWEATERDVVRLRGTHLTDSYVGVDFQRNMLLSLKDSIPTYPNSGVFWEHLEDSFSGGIEASGRLNKFFGLTGRLPEAYFDVNPMPVGSLPVNYESENRIGWLRRDYAEYGAGVASVYGTSPGPWAEYDAFRIDTYHRLTAPFRTFDDVLSVVPRVGYRGTYWDETGLTDTTGAGAAVNSGSAFRSIGEMGATFAARGAAQVDESWRHVVEPYLDFLAQEAWFSGLDGNARPYVFDNIDSSLTWEDQFAGRSRGLPYSYYGITPGLRNAWSVDDGRGGFRQAVDFDAYVAAQFNTASYTDGSDLRKLSDPRRPNYGDGTCEFVPGARLRWAPDDDTMLGLRSEYDSDKNRIAYASASWLQKVSPDWRYNVVYNMRRHRYWDFSSFPVEQYGEASFHIIEIGAEQTICEWLAWGPTLRWDLRENELDSVGAWIDYLTDCLGFRFTVQFENSFTMFDGYEYEKDWSFGFYVYLRCFGADAGNLFSRD